MSKQRGKTYHVIELGNYPNAQFREDIKRYGIMGNFGTLEKPKSRLFIRGCTRKYAHQLCDEVNERHAINRLIDEGHPKRAQQRAKNGKFLTNSDLLKPPPTPLRFPLVGINGSSQAETVGHGVGESKST